MAPRARYMGCVATLAAAVQPHVSYPDILQYSENLKAPLNKERIVARRAMWQAVYKVHPKLTFSQKNAEEMFDIVYDEAMTNKTWARSLGDEEKTEWRASIARQFRTMARHINNGRTKPWFAELGLEGEECGDAVGDSTGDSSPCLALVPQTRKSKKAKATLPSSKGSEYMYGYDSEHHMAWRSTDGQRKEFASHMFRDSTKAHPVAVFSDGSEKGHIRTHC